MNDTVERPPLVISIQSQVVMGHVGNSAALFPMQAAGLEVAAIPTVLFSNTPDYPTLRGAPVEPALFADLLLGAEERRLPERAVWIISGYIGSADVAQMTADFVARCKDANPRVHYLCDPVMGDDAPGLYVPEAIAQIMRDRLLPLADLATPNSFELGYLTGRKIASLDHLRLASQSLQLAPGGHLVATGCTLSDTPDEKLESIVIGPGHESRHPTRRVPVALPGTGDLFAALVLTGLARGHTLTASVDRAQTLTGMALTRALQLGAGEVVLSDPAFRRALLTM